MISLTEKQAQLLQFIKEWSAAKNGAVPSFEEMKEGMGLKSKSGIHRLMAALEERGYIRRIPFKARCFEVVADPTLSLSLSLSRYTNSVLAQEAKRRGLLLVDIQETFDPNTHHVTRSLVEVRA